MSSGPSLLRPLRVSGFRTRRVRLQGLIGHSFGIEARAPAIQRVGYQDPKRDPTNHTICNFYITQ